jgi:hypothetical protein
MKINSKMDLTRDKYVIFLQTKTMFQLEIPKQ